MKILVVFGSSSDEGVSAPLAEDLARDFEVECQVISAHRNLEQLRETVAAWDGDAIVAGAGLAAALPGVVAAMTELPVFGVPVAAQFGGLDSLCSILQMPPGVPVLTCGPGRAEAIGAFLRGSGGCAARLHFVAPDEKTLFDPDFVEIVEKVEDVTASLHENPAACNVFVVTRSADVRAEAFGIHMPFFLEEKAAVPAAFLDVLDWTARGGIWVGVNNTRNAARAAARLQRLTEKKEKAA